MKSAIKKYCQKLVTLGSLIVFQLVLISCSSNEIVVHNINSEGIYPVESGQGELEKSFIDYLVETFGDTLSTNTVLVILFNTTEPPLDVTYTTVYNSGGIRGYEIHGFEKFYLKSKEPIHYNERFVRDILDENFAEIVKYAGSSVDPITSSYKINYINGHFIVKVAHIGFSFVFDDIPYFSDFSELKN